MTSKRQDKTSKQISKNAKLISDNAKAIQPLTKTKQVAHNTLICSVIKKNALAAVEAAVNEQY
jgi:hypothetical protein